MSKTRGLGVALLVLMLGAAGCSSDTVSNTDPVAQVEAQVNEYLPFIADVLQGLNPFNPPQPPSPVLGFVPECLPQEDLDAACNVSGSATCMASGPDFVYTLNACTSEVGGFGITLNLVLSGSLTYLASAGEGGWPLGTRTVDFDGGAALGTFFFDLDLDGTKDAVILATVLGGLQARCCADLEAETAVCFDVEEGKGVCDPVKPPAS